MFAGRFDLEAAENVCAGAGLPVGDVLPTIAGYSMLESLRQYGLEQLRAPRAADGGTADEASLRRRHRDHYLALAERFSAPTGSGPGRRNGRHGCPRRCPSCGRRWGSA